MKLDRIIDAWDQGSWTDSPSECLTCFRAVCSSLYIKNDSSVVEAMCEILEEVLREGRDESAIEHII